MFGTVGQALLDTLAVGLGDAFTPECREAWVEAYGILSSVMIGVDGAGDGGRRRLTAPPYASARFGASQRAIVSTSTPLRAA